MLRPSLHGTVFISYWMGYGNSVKKISSAYTIPFSGGQSDMKCKWSSLNTRLSLLINVFQLVCLFLSFVYFPITFLPIVFSHLKPTWFSKTTWFSILFCFGSPYCPSRLYIFADDDSSQSRNIRKLRGVNHEWKSRTPMSEVQNEIRKSFENPGNPTNPSST